MSRGSRRTLRGREEHARGRIEEAGAGVATPARAAFSDLEGVLSSFNGQGIPPGGPGAARGRDGVDIRSAFVGGASEVRFW